MPTNTNLTEADIRTQLDEFIRSGFTLKEFCTVEDHDEAVLQSWLDKFYPELSDDGFMEVRVDPTLKDEPKKTLPPIPQKGTTQTLFAKAGDIELYHQVHAAYLKSLKG